MGSLLFRPLARYRPVVRVSDNLVDRFRPCFLFLVLDLFLRLFRPVDRDPYLDLA